MTGDGHGAVHGAVHGLMFEWREHQRQGGSGLSVVRSSLPDTEARTWNRELAQRVSVPDGDDRPSTCYLLIRGRAVLIHRMPAYDQLHRPSTVSRALVGPPSVLTFDRAITLRPDVRPPDPDGPYAGFPADWASGCDSVDDLAARVAGNREEVIRMLAGVLAGPGRDGFAVRPGPADPRLLLWATRRTVQHGAWTFSTREDNAAAAGLPEFVFVERQASRSSFAAERRWLDLSRDPGPTPAAVRAAELVDTLLTGGGPVLVRSRTTTRERPTVPLPETAPAPAGAVPPPPSQPPPSQPPRPRRVVSVSGLRTAYATRLGLLVAWSLVFILLLALAGRP